MGNKKYTLDNNTVASNPGKIIFKQSQWLKYNFKFSLIMAFLFFLSIYLSVKYSKFFFIMMVIIVIILEHYWLKLKEHYTADSNAGLVISTNPNLVAVSTNLTKSDDGNFPVIKVIKYKVRKNVKFGDKIATVSTYKRDLDDTLDHWVDFFPLPVNYATNDINEINNEINSYPKEQWDNLEKGLMEIEKPYKEGLYKVETKTSDWNC